MLEVVEVQALASVGGLANAALRTCTIPVAVIGRPDLSPSTIEAVRKVCYSITAA